MKKKEYTRWGKIISLFLAIIVVALFLEAGILENVNARNANKTSWVLLDQAVNVIEKNKQSEEELIQSLKEDYMVRAKAVSYILDANKKAEYDIKELQKIANLMSIDEIHLFDKTGTIYSGSVPKYYGYDFDSGEQMAYFKPMLKDKKLTMCQDVTPNTSEGKSMMYAITWSDTGDKMIQVGVKPVRLLEELKQNEVSTVVSNMPMYDGISIYVADKDSGKIYGATNENKIGKTLDKIGISTKKVVSHRTISETVRIDGKMHNCIFQRTGDYIVGVTFAISSNTFSNVIALIIMAIYLILAGVFILFMISKVLKANREKQEQIQKEEELIQISNTDELTGCLNRRAYEKDISELSFDTEFTYVSMDVNGLKMVNDNLGHVAGDELLQGAASCMANCFGRYGKIYRVGGDEFIAILYIDGKQFEEIKKQFDETVENWSGQLVDSLAISCGAVVSTEQTWHSFNEIIREADDRMYQIKAEYYKRKGIDRRGNRLR